MNEIKITHELCAEDRARIDRLTAALEAIANTSLIAAGYTAVAKTDAKPTTNVEQLAIPDEQLQPKTAEEPKNEPQEPTKVEAPATPPAEEEKPAEVKEPAAEEPKNEPTVTLEQIQQKVVQICAGFEGKKKPAVRAIINQYGSKVSDLKEQPDKWNEVWDKLTELEKE